MIVGIARCEEPLSILLILNHLRKQICPDKDLADVVDLFFVDVQKKSDISYVTSLGIGGGGLFSIGSGTLIRPDWGKSIEMFDNVKDKGYTFPDEVVKYLNDTINSKRTQLGTYLEVFLDKYNNFKQVFDIVICNNVLQYLLKDNSGNPFSAEGFNNDSFNEFYTYLEKLLNLVRVNGVIIVHVPKNLLDSKSSLGSGLLYDNNVFFSSHFKKEQFNSIYCRIK